MAGAGYKLFNTGDVLTAAQVNTYLQEQAVMRFANSTARTTALSGVLAEGMMSYLDDTNSVEVYNGSAWVSVGSTGDITEVQAGTGISVASGTGPIPVVTNSMATEITAKGDLIVGTGSGTFDNLAVGTNGHTLVADSSTATGLKWAAASSPTFTGCYVSKTANQSTANTSYVQLSFDNEVIDTDGFHNNVTNNSRITIPSGKGGKYFLSGTILFNTNATGSRTASMYKNGSSIGLAVFATQSGDEASATVNLVADLVAGDYIELYSRQKSGGNLDVIGGNPAYTYLIAYLIGA